MEINDGKDGLLHRENAPAIEYVSGARYWYQYGAVHRLNGPAIECSTGSKRWCKNGKYHRLDGPAIEWYNGNKEWFIDGIKYTEEEFKKTILMMKLAGLQ